MTTRLHSQRRAGDCGIACLASWCGLSYEDAYVAAVATHKDIPRKGATVTELIAVAKRLGRRFERLHFRRVDVDEHEGILGVTWNDPKAHGKVKGHWVLLRGGMIIDPWEQPATVADAHEYLAQNDGRVGTLLVEGTRTKA